MQDNLSFVFQMILFDLWPFCLAALAKMTLKLPKGTSSLELLSPNYPGSFPDDDVMEWHFEVPHKHKVAVQVEKLTEPVCLKKNTAVEYHNRAKGAMVVRLMAPQPEQRQGNFTLTLRNCEMDKKRSGFSGLSVRFLLSSSSESFPGLSGIFYPILQSLHLKLYADYRSCCT